MLDEPPRELNHPQSPIAGPEVKVPAGEIQPGVGTNPPPRPPATPARHEASLRRRRRRWLLLLLVLVALPWLWRAGRTELAHWRMAQAINSELDGDLDAARHWADTAVSLAPHVVDLRYQRARIAMAQGDAQLAYEDYTAVLVQDPDDDRGLMLRSVALQVLGRHDEAIEDAQRIVEFARREFDAHRPSRNANVEYALALNTLAYARSQANRDLDQALAEINEALQLVESEPLFHDAPHMLDTRAYIQLLRGEYQQAEDDLNEAIGVVESLLGARLDQLREDAQGLVDQRAAHSELRLRGETLAVMYHHRAQVHEALNRPQRASEDYEAARRMGYAPDRGIF